MANSPSPGSPPARFILGVLAASAIVSAVVILAVLDTLPLPLRLGVVAMDTAVFALVAWVVMRRPAGR